MKPNLDEVDKKFIVEYEAALSRAISLFHERSAEGRNNFMPPVGMFCFGPQSAITLVWMKACRLVGNSEVGNIAKQIEECEDIINYAAMCIAYIRITSAVPAPFPSSDKTEPKFSKYVQPTVNHSEK